MGEILRFYKEPELSELEELVVNGGSFKPNNGTIESKNIALEIPNTFRFTTHLEIAQSLGGNLNLIMTQYLTRGLDYWHMKDAFDRIGFRDPDIEKQLRQLCDRLVEMGLAFWVEDL